MGSGYGFGKRGLLLRVRLMLSEVWIPEVEEVGRGVYVRREGEHGRIFSGGRILLEACWVWV